MARGVFASEITLKRSLGAVLGAIRAMDSLPDRDALHKTAVVDVLKNRWNDVVHLK